MKIGFDLDGTLDRPAMRALCKHLLRSNQQVYIITGVFPEARGWQDEAAKRAKLERLGIPYYVCEELDLNSDKAILEGDIHDPVAQLYVLNAVPSTFDRDYRLIDLGLRKGALCERLGVEMFFDDSSTYCEMLPKMSGNTLVLKVGEGK